MFIAVWVVCLAYIIIKGWSLGRVEGHRTQGAYALGSYNVIIHPNFKLISSYTQ